MATVARIIPGPKPTPILNWRGNYLRFMRDPVRYLYHLRKDYGALCGFVEMADYSRASITTFSPEYNQRILSDTNLFHVRAVSMDLGKDTPLGHLGMGLPVMNGEKHRQQRRLIMPAFHKKQLKSYHDDMISITQTMLESWAYGQTRDLLRDMQDLTLSIVSHSLFGLDQVASSSMGRMLDQWLQLNISAGLISLNLPGLPMRRLQDLSKNLEKMILAIITERRATGAQGHDVLSMLIQARDEDGTAMTDIEILGQANLLFAAGSHTSSSALAWTLFLLSQHPDILSDVVDELEGVLGGSAPTPEQLHALPLLDRVVKEVMRIFSPATFATRESTEDFEMGSYHFLKGTLVLYSPFITHRLPEIYTNPTRFIPDRWLTFEPSPYEYLPFSTGARMCIGANFALMEIKIILAMILPHFRLALVPNARIDRRDIGAMMPKQGLPMTLHRQDHQFSRSPVRGNVLDMIEIEGVSPHHPVWTL
jgi:cytochrome P450